jgi:hypothetical protein
MPFFVTAMRDVLLEPEVAEFYDNHRHLPHFDERWSALSWRLCRLPQSGRPSVCAGRFLQKTDHRFPPIILAEYCFDDNRVVITNAEIIKQ